MYMILSKQQYNKLPEQYKKFFTQIGGDDLDECSSKKNTHP